MVSSLFTNIFFLLFFVLVLKSALNSKEKIKTFCANIAENYFELQLGEVGHKVFFMSS